MIRTFKCHSCQAPQGWRQEIRRRGCDRVTLDTHSFQAPGVYGRLGYTECGRTPGYPNGYDHIHLVKRLR